MHICISAVGLGLSVFLLSCLTGEAETAKYRANFTIKDNDKAISMKGLRMRTYDHFEDQCVELNGKIFWSIPFTVAHNFATKTPYSNELGRGHYSRLHVDFELKKIC